MNNLISILPPEQVHEYFVLEGSRLYRKLASGACTQLKSLDATRVVTIFKGARLVGCDIAWCLIHGNWPLFPIVQLRRDPLDFSEDNLFPARFKRLNYVEKVQGSLFYHSLSSIGHTSREKCRSHWEDLAHEFYVRDLAYVLRQEAADRELRAAYLKEHVQTTGRPALRPARTVRTARPTAVRGMEWHWHEGAWISVPVACHVADDYRRRIASWNAGARSFRFDPETRKVRAYYPDGRECI